MAFSERSLDDYVDVAQRIADFREQYPHGSLQPADPAMPYHVVRVPAGWCQQCIGRRSVKNGRDWKTCSRCQGSGVREPGEPVEDIFIVYAAAAYRTPDDLRPGIGMAWEPFPGRTPYTSASELMNAETSAWGRAIQAVLASDAKKGVASREEVRNRRAEREDGLPTNADGSLSRSQTTDAQKEQAGVMTKAQQAEHTALQPKQAEVRGKVQRVRVPLGPPGVDAPDVWIDQPAGDAWASAVPANGNDPGSISPQQQRAIHAACTGMERPERLATIGDITGRQVTSSNELSYTEAARVLEKLSAVRS